LYQPIEQQAVQLTDKAAVSAFMQFVKTEAAKQIIHGYGYSTS
jgi:molybdate transport system substrate-binding protein